MTLPEWGRIFPRSCPRCSDGDIHLVRELGLIVSSCIQCGYSRYTKMPPRKSRQYAPEDHPHGERVLRKMKATDKSRRRLP